MYVPLLLALLLRVAAWSGHFQASSRDRPRVNVSPQLLVQQLAVTKIFVTDRLLPSALASLLRFLFLIGTIGASRQTNHFMPWLRAAT